MDVSVVGGGPGGAYAALLLQKANPDWAVDVYEAYPTATTYGWGVVLPEKIYPVLRDADGPTAERIEAVNTSWDPIDNVHRGERVRCGGHPYTSVMRTDLLEILQGRCADLGVGMHFETEADPVALREESDLLVGADGLASDTREAFADRFGPTLTRQSDVYAWFGTDRSFDALSHIYVENGDGVWHGAAYPGATDTFIVDADEGTWRAAGLDGASEDEYLPYLEGVFADSLGGHGLRSKEDRWRHFVTVENDRWHDGDVVLLGDSAATAHYTIGSGTRMAMESAIALAEGLRRHPDDLGAALDWYEAERKPHVEALQSAAELSVTHFENIERYVDLEPMQLAVLYLTRTGYNSYGALAERDPSFVADLDRWFARANGQAVGPDDDVAPPMDQPFDLRGLSLRNRAVVCPQTDAGAVEGRVDPAHRERLVGLAGRDAGLVMAGPAAASPEGRLTPGTPGLYADAQVDGWADAVGRAKDGRPGAVGVELVHAGRLGARRPGGGVPGYGPPGEPLPPGAAWEVLAPSARPYSGASPTPRAMDGDDLARVRDGFAAAARRADDAGFDLLSVHAGRGHLLGSFLSPLSNRRDDRHGGSLAARLRYPVSVVAAVREAWPDRKPLAVTHLAADRADGGLSVDDGFRVARAMRDAGADLLAPVAGGTVPGAEPPDDLARARLYAHWVRHEVGVPTLSTAPVTTRDAANTLVASGRADLCRLSPGADGELPV